MSLHDIPAPPTLSQGQEIEQRLYRLETLARNCACMLEEDGDCPNNWLLEISHLSNLLKADFAYLNSAKVDAEELLDELKRKHENLQWAMDQVHQVLADDTAKFKEIKAIVNDLNLHGYERCSKIREILG